VEIHWRKKKIELGTDSHVPSREDIFAHVTEQASRGEAAAEYQLGWLYYEGIGISRDTEKAIELLKCSAEKGYIWAITKLGLIFRQDRQFVEAREMFSLGIAENLPEAFFQLAKFPQEDVISLLSRAAEQGHPVAQCRLGEMYKMPEGRVEQNLEKALEYFMMAAEQGHVEAVESCEKIKSGKDSKAHFQQARETTWLKTGCERVCLLFP